MPRIKYQTSERKQKTSERKDTLMQSRAIYSSRLPLLNKIDRLSYRQLLRLSAIVDAKDASEKREAMNFVRKLTPPERQFISQFEALGAGSALRQRVKKALADTIQNRNEQELKEINGQLLLDDMMKD